MGGGCAASTAQGAAPLGTPLGGYQPLPPLKLMCLPDELHKMPAELQSSFSCIIFCHI